MQYFPKVVCPSKVHALLQSDLSPVALFDEQTNRPFSRFVCSSRVQARCIQILTLHTHTFDSYTYLLLLSCRNNLPLGVVVVAALVVVVVVVVAQRQYPSTLPQY